jgi:transcriptional regulator with XRE-family HTH domain
MLSLISPQTAKEKFAEHIKNHRISYNFTQEELSERSQVPLSTLRRFEQSGDIGMTALIRILSVLRLLETFVSAVAYSPQPKTIKEIEKLMSKPQRKRVRKKND